MYKVISKNEPLPIQNYNFLPEPGIKLVWRGGDIVQPFFGNWFDPPYFKYVLHFYVPWRILPFLRWRIGRTIGYMGFKSWGVDSEHYLNWLPKEKVGQGSVALVLTARFDADDH